MGSEGPAPVTTTTTTVHVTGFKKFHGVPHNPTETIVNNLKEFVKQKGLQGISLGSCTVLEAAGHGVLPVLFNLMNNSAAPAASSSLFSDSSSTNEHVIWLHFGANAGASKFAIERQAVNEATFLVPDEHGWQPKQILVVPEDREISQTRQTTCPIETIEKHVKKNFDVMISDDAGRFVCNYVYYHSLRFAAWKGFKSLFVHVPLFSKIDEDTQMEFTASLLEALSQTL